MEGRKRYKEILAEFESKHKRLDWNLSGTVNPEDIPYNASELEIALREFYSTLNDEDKSLFEKYIHLAVRKYFDVTGLIPKDIGYRDYENLLENSFNPKYWSGNKYKAEHIVFKTKLNESFFKFIVEYFESEAELIPTTFHFLYYLFTANGKVISRKDYIIYVNENYLNYKRLVALGHLTKSDKKTIRRTILCKEAVKKWNETNPTINLSYSIYKSN